jgi:hypothetical protein
MQYGALHIPNRSNVICYVVIALSYCLISLKALEDAY